MNGWHLTNADDPNASYCKDFGYKTAFATPEGVFGVADRKPGYPNYREIARRCGGATGAMRYAEDHFALARQVVLRNEDFDDDLTENEWLSALEEAIREAAEELRLNHRIERIAVLVDNMDGSHTVVEATADNVPDHYPL